MTDPEQAGAAAGDDDELTPGYKAPAQKTVDELQNLDAEDESLNKYKAALGLGTKEPPVFPNDPRKVIVTKLGFCPKDRDEMELDLTGDLSKVKENPIVVKEGCKFKLKVHFYVQYEIVSGLRYHQQIFRKGIKIDKDNYMVGSYGPKQELQVFISPEDEAPSGMLARGSYSVKSQFTDDDKNVHLAWEWKLKIEKGWE